jgi:4-hydroxybenzoate polyprenyltransferase
VLCCDSFGWCDININDAKQVQEVSPGFHLLCVVLCCTAVLLTVLRCTAGSVGAALLTVLLAALLPLCCQVYELLHKNYVEDDDAMFR